MRDEKEILKEMIPIHLRGSNDSYNQDNSWHRAKKAKMLHDDMMYDQYRKMLESDPNPESLLEDIKALDQYEQNTGQEIGDVSMNYIKSKKAKDDWKSMGFGKGYEKEEEVKEDKGPSMFSKIMNSISGPKLKNEATEFFDAAKKGEKRKKK